MENIKFTLSAEDCDTIFEALCDQEAEIADSQLTDMFMMLTKMDTEVDCQSTANIDDEIGDLADRVLDILDEIGDTSDLNQVPIDMEEDDIDAWEQWVAKTKASFYDDLEAPDTVVYVEQVKVTHDDVDDDSGWSLEDMCDCVSKTWRKPLI